MPKSTLIRITLGGKSGELSSGDHCDGFAHVWRFLASTLQSPFTGDKEP